MEGIVFNIQRFTVHDGPGIRTEIFLKGCPLHCRWCSNPEGMNPCPEVAVMGARCIGLESCGYCRDVCPVESGAVFRVDEGKVVGIDRDGCTRCLACAAACPANAIQVFGRAMTVDEVVRKLLADREFYNRSGGGITISGGEPLLQWQFALEIFKECKRENLHTCLESSLQCQGEVLRKVYPFVDMVYTDIKHMDAAKHRELTGADNRVILRNIRTTVEMGKPLVIRIPLVPGHNNSEENIRATAEFIVTVLENRVLQVQLLPYRPLGAAKYKALGVEDPMADVKRWERAEYETEIRQLAELLGSYGIYATAGTNLPAGEGAARRVSAGSVVPARAGCSSRN